MILAVAALLFGLILLLWSADRFVEGSASTASHFGMPPLLIGMVVVGFGTSAPEMVVSILAASQGSPGIALGNAYGSNITNIALILGLSALIKPIFVSSGVLRRELPILTAVTIISGLLLWDGLLSQIEAVFLLLIFAGLMLWTIREGLKTKSDSLSLEVEQKLEKKNEKLGLSIFWLVAGLILLVVSSRILVWGAVELAQIFGISDLVIGLTIVAIGTSLPELASSLIAASKGQHDIALGNILGSNLFNTLAVVGLAGTIRELPVSPAMLSRDILLMTLLTVSLFVICWGFKGRQGVINRYEGAILLLVFVGYTIILMQAG